MFLVSVGLLFGLVVLLWCFVLIIVRRDSARRRQRPCTEDREVRLMAHRSHAA